MRTKLFILLALFVAFSSASFAQVDSDDDHTVTVDLTEHREVEIAGVVAPNIEIVRLASGDLADTTNWIPSTGSSLNVFHDIALAQKIVVEASAPTGDWMSVYLAVEADAAIGWGTPEGSVQLMDGTLVPTGPKDLITAIADMTVGGTQNATLEYTSAAALTAQPGIRTVTVTYTMLDNS